MSGITEKQSIEIAALFGEYKGIMETKVAKLEAEKQQYLASVHAVGQ